MMTRVIPSFVLVVALIAIAPGQALGQIPPGGTGKVALADNSKQIVLKIAKSDDEDPAAAGKVAASAVKKQLGDLPVKAILVGECFEGKEAKAKVLAGVCTVFDAALVHGGSTYGGFVQGGVAGGESVVVTAIAGRDVEIAIACVEKMNTTGLTLENNREELEKKLSAAGGALAKQFTRSDKSRLLMVVADAHSPKNGSVVQGIQSVLGASFPVTGGSVNKNAGQSFVYFKGQMLSDAVIGLMLSGDFKLAMSGRQAKENDLVIATAKEGAAEAIAGLQKQGASPAFMLAFDCAGRKGKLKNVADELAAIQQTCGTELPILGTYNAGEIGPADIAEKTPGTLSYGVGWHAMFTAIGW